jgi:F0F1-type ATP synthase membrane subunit b/b'
MADPTGTVGAPHTADNSDLALVTVGGPKFMARLQQIADATNRLEQAAAKMRIGDNVEVSLQQAEAKLADAEAQNQKAWKALADAQSRAATIVEQASKKASATVEAALAAGARAQAEADQRCKDAAAYAKRVRDEADTIIRADAARREAEAKGREIDSRLNRLNVSLREIRREWESRP